MWVVKIGGSLQDSPELKKWLDVIQLFGKGRVVIVPGGGKFADEVRESQKVLGFDDDYAHAMALLAMEQYALVLKRLKPELRLANSISSINNCLANSEVALWLPFQLVAGDTTIPASWDITADSLAAWLAVKLQISSLVLVKSVALPADFEGYDDLVRRGLVDAGLSGILRDSNVRMRWLQSSDRDALATLLGNTSGLEAAIHSIYPGNHEPNKNPNPLRD